MTRTVIARQIAKLQAELREAEFKWMVAEAIGDVHVNLDPHSEAFTRAARDYHRMRIACMDIRIQLKKAKARL